MTRIMGRDQGVIARVCPRGQQLMRKDGQQAKRNIADPRLLIPWSEAASRDRLSSTLFLAGLLHGVILLGVTFTGVESPPETSSTSFDVVLITDTNDLVTPADSDMLAQQNMTGAGNTDEPMQLQTALNQTIEASTVGSRAGWCRTTATGRQREHRRTTDDRRTVDREFTGRAGTNGRRGAAAWSRSRQSFAGTSSAIEIINEARARDTVFPTASDVNWSSARTRVKPASPHT